MKTVRNIVALVIALVLTLSLVAVASADTVFRTLDEIKASGTINIGVFSDKNPFGYVDENGEYQGYDVYFARRIGEDLGVTVNYVSTEAANRVEYLETGKVDIVLANNEPPAPEIAEHYLETEGKEPVPLDREAVEKLDAGLLEDSLLSAIEENAEDESEANEESSEE